MTVSDIPFHSFLYSFYYSGHLLTAFHDYTYENYIHNAWHGGNQITMQRGERVAYLTIIK